MTFSAGPPPCLEGERRLARRKCRGETNMGPEDNPADDIQPTKEDWDAYEASQQKVFDNCNVCGIKLRTLAEDRMGMCERCAAE